MKGLTSVYYPKFLKTIVYMLQSSEYNVAEYLAWLRRTNDFSQVMYRRTLDPTKAARLLLLGLRSGVVVEVAIGIAMVLFGMLSGRLGWLFVGWLLVLLYPFVAMYIVVIPLEIGRRLIVAPRHKKAIADAKGTFRDSKAPKIAIVGSYGKTSMKELLLHVLGHKLNVAATPANKNVAISHAAFAQNLTGAEDIILIEYGEGSPGDVAAFTHNTHPTHAIITGLAPAHLDQYKTLQAAGEDIFSVTEDLPVGNVYVNQDSPSTKDFMQPAFEGYSQSGTLGWKVTGVEVGLKGTSFTLTKGKEKLRLASGLLGRHNIGPLALAATLAKSYGLSSSDIQEAVASTKPHEHRMQPYQLAGAWIIDDTYNGNIEGIRAGTQLLAELPARRKIYVTPGLVEQGEEVQPVHLEMGKLIAGANPDIVVLMQNSVTDYIKSGLEQAGFNGQLKIEQDPLNFYTHLDQFVAGGDVVLMQNDWPDNYR